MGFNEYVAIRYTPFFAQRVPWVHDINKVAELLGFTNHYPPAKEFVNAVYRWQRTHGLVADGMLGPKTWKVMAPYIQQQTGTHRFMGPDPEWVTNLKRTKPNNAMARPSTRTPQILPSAEDKLIQEMVDVILKQKKDMYAPIEVTGAYLAKQAYPKGLLQSATGIMIIGTIEVGQQWKFQKGARIVLGLQPSGPESYGLEILFITDSGKAYTQSLKGWFADAQAALFSDVAKKLAPIKLLLDVEAQLLLGAISASGFVGFVVVAGGGATQWVLNNKEKLANWILAFKAAYYARKYMKANTPVLYDKVFEKVLSAVFDVIAEIPESAVSDAKNMARLIGGVFYQAGKMLLLRDFKVATEVIGFLLKTIMAAVRALPGAIKLAGDKKATDAASQLLEQLRLSGITISMDEANKIIQEIAKNPDGIKKVLESLEDAFSGLD